MASAKDLIVKPISAAEPCNTLVWQCEFPDIESARSVLDFFSGDAAHEELFAKQVAFFEQVRVEFYENLDF